MNSRITLFEEKIARVIDQVFADDEPRTLYDPARYTLSLGGKRLRPLLTLMAADLFGKDVDEALDAATAVEIFHNFSLLHDDLMDKADMRRGYPTVHKKWDANSAILSGDAMVIEAYRYIAKVPVALLPEILDTFSTAAIQICQGQQHDMDFEKRTDVSEKEYLEMIRLKTAVLIGCALKLGAIIAGASSQDAQFMYEYGINLGLAFQLKDDLLDVYGDPRTFGKKIGGDILCNKKTFLLIKALKNSGKSQRESLEQWLSASDFDPEEKIRFVKNMYDELNLKLITGNLIEKYYLASLDCLSSVSVSEDRKKELIELSENLMYREK
ncbi:MAG: isoprenyl synthetase [Bacteroidetes bacterium GWD2_45_23]|nr:MAG: isoprenyl synthetase [Bacteroidetes bacterium GWC2_46_850]OFX75149.1 MAG: isoprenyl synthetase [Bacteroidetes bacterium GWC1_47_7]OFX86175.1 MAG: isoprenyl synthetase [Bacteroidetes bacterium GWD2_45_23]HAR37423.1 isoprenyl synthetase [Porphyromonadaceae bacterium]HCC17306.1 isoprenyl synthetase [Porphyromonadaceae bacterium]